MWDIADGVRTVGLDPGAAGVAELWFLGKHLRRRAHHRLRSAEVRAWHKTGHELCMLHACCRAQAGAGIVVC
jgi:hypothetical protein